MNVALKPANGNRVERKETSVQPLMSSPASNKGLTSTTVVYKLLGGKKETLNNLFLFAFHAKKKNESFLSSTKKQLDLTVHYKHLAHLL